MTIKTAICVKKSDIFPTGVDASAKDVFVLGHEKFLASKVTLEDRATCETDETLLQVIPYITIHDKTTGEVFIYRRGNSSGESRLTGMCSVGLGGHMELLVNDNDMTLTDIIVIEAARELNEEIGIELSGELHATIREKLTSGNFGIMYNNRTEVDRVHIAVAFFIEVNKEEIMKLTHEADVITKGQWMTLSDIENAVSHDVFEIEHWTRMIIESSKQAVEA